MGARPRRKQFTGYKVHAAADAVAPILIAVSLSPGNEHDGHHAGPLIDQQPEDMRPARVIGDTAYGNVEAREELEQRQVEVLAPVHSSSPKDGTIPKERFHIDLDSDTVTCPESKTTPIYKRSRHKPNVTGERVARFAERTASPARSGPTAHRAGNETSGSDVVKTCDRPRSGRYPTQPSASTCIEPGQGSSGCSDSSFTATTDARVATSELENPALQAAWTAVLVNLHPIGAALRAQAA